MKEFLEDLDYMDAYGLINDDKKGYTWRKLNPKKKQARLDYFFINFDVFVHLDDCQIVPGYRSDHSGVLLKLDFFEQARGKGYWKFNNSLLKDKKYTKIVKDTIDEVVSLHLKETKFVNENSNNNDYNNNDSDQNKEFIINDQLLLETILMMIRGETIKYSSFKKKKQSEEEKQLEKEIENIEAKITNSLNEITEDDINRLE